VELTPSRVSRLAHATLGVAAGALGLGVAVEGSLPGPIRAALAALLVGLGVVIVVRSRGLGVECRNGQVRVRGLLLTRVVPRADVDEVTDFPALVWRDGGGRRRWTPIVFLMDSPGALTRFRQENVSSLLRLRRWIADGRR
jgi:hypothetical protein